MSGQTFTREQRAAILRAAEDWRTMRADNPRADVVDVATETGNYFWSGLTDRACRIALRYMGMAARA